jgi:hypothetical protein
MIAVALLRCFVSDQKAPFYDRHVGKLLAWCATVIVATLALLVAAASFIGDERERRSRDSADPGVHTTSLPPPVTAKVPESYVGRWRGLDIRDHKDGGESSITTVDLVIRAGAIDTDVGSLLIRLASADKVGCEGRLLLDEVGDYWVGFRLKNARGPKCPDEPFAFQMVSGEIKYEFMVGMESYDITLGRK